MARPKKVRSNDTPKVETPTTAIPETNQIKSWEFRIRGRGTSGWNSFVKEENGDWIPLRPSDTSFISAIAAIEPEVMRLAFPHNTTQRKPK